MKFLKLRIIYYRKQIAANTRRLVMSKHAQKVEEAPLIRTRLNPDASIGVFADESVEKGNLCFLQFLLCNMWM